MITIYEITYADKHYIGQTGNYSRRKREHLRRLMCGTHHNKTLQKLYNSNTADIEFTELLYCTSEDADMYEIAIIKCTSNCINATGGGLNPRGMNHPRVRYTEEVLVEVLKAMSDDGLTYADISTRLKVPHSLISNIRTGVSHVWMADRYPELYKAATQPRKKKQVKQYVHGTLIYNGVEYCVTGAIPFVRQHPELFKGVSPASAGRGIARVLDGSRKTYKGWTKK